VFSNSVKAFTNRYPQDKKQSAKLLLTEQKRAGLSVSLKGHLRRVDFSLEVLFVDEDEVGLVVLGMFDEGGETGFVHVIYE